MPLKTDKLSRRIEKLEKRIERLEKCCPATIYDNDELLKQAEKTFKKKDKISAALVQRKFGIGYARAARILNQLKNKGYSE